MEFIKEVFTQNIKLTALFIAACIAAVLMIMKAAKAVRRNKIEKEAMIKKLDHLKMLKEKYEHAGRDEILEDNGEFLLEGLVWNIQRGLEKEENMEERFEALSKPQKQAYAVYYFLEACEKKPSSFFKDYTKPLTPYVPEAMGAVFGADMEREVQAEYDAYDPDNETASLIETEIEKNNENILALLKACDVQQTTAQFIKKHVSDFCGA